ncbi:MAG: hypothetical protein ABJH05_02285 [Fulvivirga sp.]
MDQNKLYRENNSVINTRLGKYIKTIANYLPGGLPRFLVLLLPSAGLYIGVFVFNYYPLGMSNHWFAPMLVFFYVLLRALCSQYLLSNKMFTANAEIVFGGLNIINLGVITTMLINLFAINELNYLIFSSLGLVCASLTYYKQFKTSILIIPRIGQTELLLILACIVFLSNLKPANDYYNLPIGSFILFDVVILLISCGFLLYALRLLVVTKNVTYGVWLFIGSIVITTIFAALSLSLIQAIIVITIYCASYAIKLKTATLLDGLERSAGLFTPLVLVTAYFMESLYPRNTFIILMAYLGFSLLMFCYRTFARQQTASEEE